MTRSTCSSSSSRTGTTLAGNSPRALTAGSWYDVPPSLANKSSMWSAFPLTDKMSGKPSVSMSADATKVGGPRTGNRRGAENPSNPRLEASSHSSGTPFSLQSSLAPLRISSASSIPFSLQSARATAGHTEPTSSKTQPVIEIRCFPTSSPELAGRGEEGCAASKSAPQTSCVQRSSVEPRRPAVGQVRGFAVSTS